jgi:hypothetical protein
MNAAKKARRAAQSASTELCIQTRRSGVTQSRSVCPCSSAAGGTRAPRGRSTTRAGPPSGRLPVLAARRARDHRLRRWALAVGAVVRVVCPSVQESGISRAAKVYGAENRCGPPSPLYPYTNDNNSHLGLQALRGIHFSGARQPRLESNRRGRLGMHPRPNRRVDLDARLRLCHERLIERRARVGPQAHRAYAARKNR